MILMIHLKPILGQYSQDLWFDITKKQMFENDIRLNALYM